MGASKRIQLAPLSLGAGEQAPQASEWPSERAFSSGEKKPGLHSCRKARTGWMALLLLLSN